MAESQTKHAETLRMDGQSKIHVGDRYENAQESSNNTNVNISFMYRFGAAEREY